MIHLSKWCVHSYYTVCPYAPDGSGRILFSGCDLKTGKGKIYIADANGTVLDSFGENIVEASFFHTGFWQTWSPDAKYVYYQGGSNKYPQIIRHNLLDGTEISMPGDLEGAPPFGEPITSAYMGMLYAAGYGDGTYSPKKAPFPFQERDKHGLFRFDMEQKRAELVLSVEEVLERHPDRDKLQKADREMKRLYGEQDGLTLMCYCLRWSTDGERCLFYFGNHTVGRVRTEPRLSYICTAKKDMTDVHVALDLSYEKRGVHWSMHPDGERLIGYGPKKDDPGRWVLSMVNRDGSDFYNINSHDSGGHPSVCPTDYNLIVTDEKNKETGRVVLFDAVSGAEIGGTEIPYKNVDVLPPGRNRHFVCPHPVFHRGGHKILCNTMREDYAGLVEFEVAKLIV